MTGEGLSQAELLCLLRAVDLMAMGRACELSMEELVAARVIGEALESSADQEIMRREVAT